MEIVNRRRGITRDKVSYKNNKVTYNFDLRILDLMCSYIVSENKFISTGNVNIMKDLLDAIDLSVYENDIEKRKRISFIKRGIEARLVYGLKNPVLIISHINGGVLPNPDDELSLENINQISTEEVKYLDKMTSVALSSSLVDGVMDEFYDLYVKWKATDYAYRDSMLEKITEFLKDSNCDLRNAKTKDASNRVFSFEEGKFESELSDTYDTLTSSSRFLMTGMQGFNMTVGGGLESTRLYLLVGLAGIGKSMILLNLAMQIKKANKGYITKDPTKKPTILFLTQENSIDETVDRIVNMITGNRTKDYSKEELIDILKTSGQLNINDENNINIHIIYKPDRSISTGDLYSIIDDLEEDGYEVICLIQDHIKRIRSVEKASELRVELGCVVNELKTLAQAKDIPIISVSHLNREASKNIDSSMQDNKTDLTRVLGRSNIGESMLMIDNADCVLITNKEYDKDNNAYIVFKNIKIRNADNIVDYFCQPFEANSSTKLAEDLYMSTPIFRITLGEEVNSPQIINGATVKASTYTNINALEQDDTINLYNPLKGSSYSSADILGQEEIKIPNKILILPKETPIPIPEAQATTVVEPRPLMVFY